MKIKSNFKDYYDHITHTVMNGGDDKVVYVRSRIKELGYTYDKTPIDRPFNHKWIGIASLPRDYTPNIQTEGDVVYEYAWLIVAGRYYPLYRQYKYSRALVGISRFSDELSGFVVVKQGTGMYNKFFPSRELTHHQIRMIETIDPKKVQPLLVDLSKDIGHPVFVITETHRSEITISRKCPNLGKMGLPMVYSDMEIYQDIYYFIANEMRGDPDEMPALKPPMNSKDKIVSHGFDLKQSFRHRK